MKTWARKITDISENLTLDRSNAKSLELLAPGTQFPQDILFVFPPHHSGIPAKQMRGNQPMSDKIIPPTKPTPRQMRAACRVAVGP